MSHQEDLDRLNHEASRLGGAVLSQDEVARIRAALLEYYMVIYDQRRMTRPGQETVVRGFSARLAEVQRCLSVLDTLVPADGN